MADKFVPTWYCNSIYEIDFAKLKSLGIKYVLSDLDNTLVGYDVPTPTDKTINLINYLKEINLELIVISNNTKKRLDTFCNFYKIRYLSNACKPFKGKLLKFLDEKEINKSNCVLIGDQLLTDVWCAKKAKLNSILVEPLQKKESIKTYFNRKIDKRLRNKYRTKGKLCSIGKEE